MTLGEFYARTDPVTATAFLAAFPLGVWKALELIGAVLDWWETSHGR